MWSRAGSTDSNRAGLHAWHSWIATSGAPVHPCSPSFAFTPCVLPACVYGAETRTMTKAMSAEADVFDQWCLRRIVRILYSQHASDAEARRVAQFARHCPRPSVTESYVRLFGHRPRPITHADPEMDHCRALHAVINNSPRDWKRRRGRPTHTWTRTVEADPKSCNV